MNFIDFPLSFASLIVYIYILSHYNQNLPKKFDMRAYNILWILLISDTTFQLSSRLLHFHSWNNFTSQESSMKKLVLYIFKQHLWICFFDTGLKNAVHDFFLTFDLCIKNHLISAEMAPRASIKVAPFGKLIKYKINI